MAGRDADLPGDEIEASDHLGDRMLDLQAGVHFEKVEVAILVEEKLDRAGADIVAGARSEDGGGAHGLAQLFGHHRTG